MTTLACPRCDATHPVRFMGNIQSLPWFKCGCCGMDFTIIPKSKAIQ